MRSTTLETFAVPEPMPNTSWLMNESSDRNRSHSRLGCRAALPLTTITAYESLFERLRIDLDGNNSDATLLIIGGAGGVGSMAIQLAKLAGLRVIATASRPESTAWVKALGVGDVVNHREPLRPQIEARGLDFVDYIIAIYNDTDGHWSCHWSSGAKTRRWAQRPGTPNSRSCRVSTAD